MTYNEQEPNLIDITGLDKAEVLKVLYDCAQPKGENSMGWLQYRPEPMAIENARKLIAAAGNDLDFDYVGGRVMKVDITENQFRPDLYDRDNGQGTAARAIASLRARGERL